MMDQAAREFNSTQGKPLSYSQILQGYDDYGNEGVDDDPEEAAEEMERMGFDEPGLAVWNGGGRGGFSGQRKKKKSGGVSFFDTSTHLSTSRYVLVYNWELT
jgi:hypothetical protein